LGKPFDIPSNTNFVETSKSYEVEEALNTFYIEKGNEIIKKDLSYMDLQAKSLSYYNREFLKKLMEEYKYMIYIILNKIKKIKKIWKIWKIIMKINKWI